MTKIIEQIIKVDQSKLNEYPALISGLNYIYIIAYEDEPSELITCTGSTNEFEIIALGFENYLKQFELSKFNECVFVATTYLLFGSNIQQIKIDHIKNYQFKYSIEFLDYFLKDTFGILLYHYQIEQLYVLAKEKFHGEDQKNASQFRKDINKKLYSTFEEAKKIIIYDNVSLFDFILDRMIFGFTSYPNYAGAKILYTKQNKNYGKS